MTREEAINVVKNNWPDSSYTRLREALETLIPEFKESEDERMVGLIRKAVYTACDEETEKEILAWLEKKGEQKPYTFNAIPRLLEVIKPTDRVKEYCQKLIDSLEKEGYKKDAKIVDGILKQWNGEKVPMATMDEQDKQEPADKVEQTFFKAGNWYLCVKDFLGNCGVRFDKGHVYHCGNDGCLQEFDSGAHIAIDERLFDYFNLWTIGDAKDGDVLAFYSEYRGNKMVQVGIIEKYVGKHGGCSNTFKIHVGVNWENNLQIGEYMGCYDIQPATQEQRELLFAKMKEADYEWDAEKNALKAIDKKPTDLPKGEDYGIDGLGNAITILEKTLGEVDGYQTDDGILEHKCAISAVKELYEQKPAWSEEDEHRLKDTIYFLETAKKHYAGTTELDACIAWLKSLKEKCTWSAIAAAKSFLQEESEKAYVVTRCEEHSDYVERVFFDKNKAEEYCAPYNENEHCYSRDITEIDITL